MNYLMLTELREKIREIRTREQAGVPAEIEREREQIVAAVETLVRLSIVSRKDGGLALENEIEQLAENLFYGELLREFVLLVVDGTDPESVEEIGLQKYFAGDMKAYEGLTCLLFLKGILAICRNENPRCMELKLRSMLTAEMDEAYLRKKQEKIQQEQKMEPDLSKVTMACAGTFLKFGEEGVGETQDFVVKSLERVILNTSNWDLQRLLRETENSILKVAMKGFGRAARRHIFDNMSKKLAVLIAEEMMLEGDVRMQEIVEASQYIMDIWNRLLENGEVADAGCGHTD